MVLELCIYSCCSSVISPLVFLPVPTVDTVWCITTNRLYTGRLQAHEDDKYDTRRMIATKMMF